MNIFEEIKRGVNEMDPVQKQLTTGEKTAAFIITVHILGYMLLSITESFVWATISYVIYITMIISIMLWVIIGRETYYIIKRILDNMEGMW